MSVSSGTKAENTGGNPFLRILCLPFSLLFQGIRALFRGLIGGIYDLFAHRKEEIIYRDLLEGDYFDYTLEEILQSVDVMDGYDFENFSAALLGRKGFEKIEVTKGSGDQGVDIIAEKEEIVYAFQCKNFSTKLGNTPIQEVAAGRVFYNCHVGVVLTNSFFTEGAEDLAKANMILLWDRSKLEKMVSEVLERS